MELKRIDIRKNAEDWNNYITSNSVLDINGCFIAHNPCLAEIFEGVFGYKSEYYYLIEKGGITGLLPGFRIKNKFISMPIFPSAGLFTSSKCDKFQIYKNIISGLGQHEIRDTIKFSKYIYDKKILCYLQLKENPDLQWDKFSGKVRNQIKKGYKNGIEIKIGKSELLDEFYNLYSINMHNLGSPVLEKKFFLSLIKSYKNGIAQIFIAYLKNNPIGGGFVLSFNNLFEVGWASTLREYNKYNPNMVLYWEMIKSSIENGMEFFSFGRATRSSGSHKFKLQWGVKEIPIYFNYSNYTFDIRRLKFLGNLWQKLPLKTVNKVGPFLRRLTKI